MGFATLAPITFIRQSIKDFRNTGSIMPSSPFLARAMVECLPRRDHVPEGYRVLEVGPGTGPFTRAAARRLAIHGHLDLYEISELFAKHLRESIAKDACFEPLRGRVRVFCADVREVPAKPVYDAVISGLPFNNFTPSEVRQFLEHLSAVLKPGGTLTFFEYFGIRRLQTPFVSQTRRTNLREIARVVKEFSRRHEFRQEIVPLNLLPARVRHLRFANGTECSA
jgi:phosphatidylethanolamine/phosphatidyl-N-methylethanolamine N-methyltransferase